MKQGIKDFFEFLCWLVAAMFAGIGIIFIAIPCGICYFLEWAVGKWHRHRAGPDDILSELDHPIRVTSYSDGVPLYMSKDEMGIWQG